MTFKKAILRGLIGIPIGVFINTTIALFFSLYYSNVTIATTAYNIYNPVDEFLIQYIVSVIIGFVFGFGSSIFEVERWSITKQTILHFLLTSIVFMPCALIAKWVNINVISITIYFIVFIFIYVVIWSSIYFYWKNKVQQINNKLQKK